MKVAKFGGSSLALSKLIKHVLGISNDYQVLVVSAPGTTKKHKVKITDLLGQWFETKSKSARQKIKARFSEIIIGLDIDFDIEKALSDIEKDFSKHNKPDFALSRGEYLNAHLIALASGRTFIDPSSFITIKKDGSYECDEKALRKLVGKHRVVIPGFYGSSPKGSIRTFSRGGSDITGAIVSAALGAAEYHNWTDVSGIYTADPRFVDEATAIDMLTYTELRELGNLGTSIFHPDAIRPVKLAGIPTVIKNTMKPDDPGSRIVNAIAFREDRETVVTGIARNSDFIEVRIGSIGMGSIPGYMLSVLQIFYDLDISYEFKTEARDSFSIFITEDQLRNKLEILCKEIRKKIKTDTMSVNFDRTMLSVVGADMKGRPGVSGAVFDALADAGINVAASTQGGSEISITVVVETDVSARALRVLHQALF